MRILICFVIISLAFVSNAFSEEQSIREDYTFSVGYNVISKEKNATLLSEYAPLSSSPTFFLDFANLSGHNKYSAELNFLNKDDMYLNINYRYKDIISSEFKKNDFFHNLSFKNFGYNSDYVNYQPFNNYFIDVTKNSLFFKIKPTTLPYHIRAYIEESNSDGRKQKRFYGSWRLDSLPLDNKLYSTSKPFDLRNEFYQFSVDGIIGGINFLGLLELSNLKDKDIDNSHGGQIGITPSLTKNYNHIALYSNQTGQISYALSFTQSNINNNKRDELNQKSAEYSYNNSSAIFTYYPAKDLKLYLKMRYEDREESSPDIIRFLNVDYYSKNQIPQTTTTLIYGLVYNLSKEWRFKYEGKNKETKRSGVVDNEWLLANTFAVEGKIDKTKVKIKETLEYIENPYYKGTPKSQYKTTLNLSNPLNNNSGIDFEYNFIAKNNDDTNYYIQEGLTNSFMFNYYYNFDENLDLSCFLGYDKDRYKFDINIFGGGNIPNTPYKSTRVYGDISINKLFNKKYSFRGDVFYQRVYGNYYPDTNYLINDITSTDYYQYGINIGNGIKINDSQLIKLDLSYSKHIEKSDDDLSGSIKKIYIAWEKRW